MKDNHIIGLIEEKSPGGLSAGEQATIENHIADCADCRRAYAAARISALLIKERAAEVIEPSPFFKTRVLAALKERQSQPEIPALVRMWKAAGALVAMMASLVVLLAGLTFFSYGDGQTSGLLASQGADSLEWVVFEEDDYPDEGTDFDLVLTMTDAEGADGQ